FALEAQVSQALFRHRREERNGSLWVDFQQIIVAEVGNKKVSFAIERNAVGALEEVACGERRHRTVTRDLYDRIASAVPDIDLFRFSVYCNAYRAAQACGHEWLRLSLPVHLGNGVAVVVRLQQVSFVVDRVAGSAIEAGREFVALSFGRNLPNEISEVRHIQ